MPTQLFGRGIRMRKLKYLSYGAVYDEARNFFCLSGGKNRIVDFLTGKELCTFGHIYSLYPVLSKSGDYIALANTNDGIEIIDTTSWKTVYRYIPKPKQEQHCYNRCKWLMENRLIYATKENLVQVKEENHWSPKLLFDLNSLVDVSEFNFYFLKSFDANDQTILMIYYCAPKKELLIALDTHTMESRIIAEFPCFGPNDIRITSDDRCYLMDNESVKLMPSIQSSNVAIEKSFQSCTPFDYETSENCQFYVKRSIVEDTKVVIYDMLTWNSILSVEHSQRVYNMNFSSNNHYIFLCGRTTTIIDL